MITPVPRTAVSVRDFGATGNGSTNDTTAISKAITAAGVGGHVTIPKGTYIVATASAFQPVFALSSAGLTIQAEPGAVVKLAATSAAGSYMFGVQADDITIRGLGLNGNGIASAIGVNVRVTSSARAAISGCTFKNFDGGSGSTCVQLSNNPTDTRITGNAFYDFVYGVLTSSNSNLSGLVIANNTFDGNNTNGDAIEINTPSGAATRVTITGNLVKNMASSGSSNGIGIALAHVTESVIANNIVRSCGLDGIHVEDASENVTVSANVVTDCGRSGIAVNSSNTQATRYTRGVVVTGNTVARCLTTSGTGGIAVEGNLSHYQCAVIANRVTDCGRVGGAFCFGIDLQFGATGDRVAYNMVSNTIGVSTAGIRIAGSTNVLVQGNRCYDDQAVQTQDFGILIEQSQTDLHVLDNNVLGNGTGGIDLSGVFVVTRMVRRNNVGHVTEANGTATIISGTTSVAVTHGLAVTPALKDISVTPTNSLGNAAKYWISSPTSTQFTISVNADPGATTATFAWEAVVR
jgi:parallel beta-helix repeat protein